MHTNIRVSVPGSIMLMGEHSVLFGEPALACAVDKYIHVELTPRSDDQIRIDSALAQYQSTLHHLENEPKLSFVIAAITALSDHLSYGFELTIRSEFSHTVGLGSSAAVSLGVVAALCAYANINTDKPAIFERTLNIVHHVQDGRGSGTDLAASLYGAVVAYNVHPRSIEALPFDDDICLFYSGYKTKTPDVLKIVEQQAQQQPDIYTDIYRLMGCVTQQAIGAIKNNQTQQLGALMNTYQGLMDALGVSDKTLSDMIYTLRQDTNILGAKISGSGLGDCIIGLGAQHSSTLDYESIPVRVSKQGLRYEHH